MNQNSFLYIYICTFFLNKTKKKKKKAGKKMMHCRNKSTGGLVRSKMIFPVAQCEVAKAKKIGEDGEEEEEEEEEEGEEVVSR